MTASLTRHYHVGALFALHHQRAATRANLKKLSEFGLDILYAKAKTKLWSKIERLRGVPNLNVADFGTRRRHSFLWQDYSHKPGAVEAVLRSLRPVTQGNLIIVLGCGGDRDRAKRPMMGAAAASLADVAILTSDNPRSEDPLAILAAMLDGVLSVPQEERARVIIEPDRAAAIAQAVALTSPGDVVVVAGKGHETGQYVAGSVLPFDDREVTETALSQLAKVHR